MPFRGVDSGHEDGFVHLQACIKQCNLAVDKLRSMAATRQLGPEADELRDLSLTLACYDYALYSFVAKLSADCGLPTLRRNTDLVEAVASLRHRLASTPTKSLPLGGIVSMLHHMISALDDTSAVLDDLRTRRRAKLISAAKTALAALLLLAVRRGMIFSRFPQRRLLTAIALAVLTYRTFWSLSVASKNIQACNRSLLILLRMWQLSLDVFGQANMSKSRSYPSLLATASPEDYSDPHKPNSRRLLEQTMLPLSSSVWIHRSRALVLLRFGLQVAYACMHVGYTLRKRTSLLRHLQWPATVLSGVFYTLRPSAAQAKALSITNTPDMRFIKYLWSFFDGPAARAASRLVMTPIETFCEVDIEGVRCHILADMPVPSGLWTTKGPLATATHLHHTDGDDDAPTVDAPVFGRVSSLTRLSARAGWCRHDSITEDPNEGDGSDSSSQGDASTTPVDTSHDLPFPPPAGASMITPSLPSPTSRSSPELTPDTPVLMFIHGGGFIASLAPNDMLLLSAWAKRERIVVSVGTRPTSARVEFQWGVRAQIVFVHYSLSPEKRYPTALNECVAVYQWLRSHTSRIVVCGESAGGHIATALILKCITEGILPPLRLLLCYPAIDLNSSASTSRAVHMGDPLLPMRLMTSLAALYMPIEQVGKPIVNDPYLCPFLATDAQLRKFPCTRILAGGMDPLLDDSIELHSRLLRARVDVALQVFRNLPHGFLGASFVPAAQPAIETFRQWACEPLTG